MSNSRLVCIVACLFFTVIAEGNAANEQPKNAASQTGPQTEKRFPPLVVPPGFKATLFACDPLVEYPSVIALGPRPGTAFVAHDYMTGLGTAIVRRDEVRLLADTDGDGYADKSTVYAGGFNSIMGLAYSAGTVFVMHAPLLTLLRDTNGDGVADERRDLLSGLGLKPEDNPERLHCANGVVAGYDGWLYLALGDHGVDVPRPEGNHFVLHGGGILRCRADGRELHVFAGGLRNIYDVALDDEQNVFVRDNENDGGDYMIRVCNSFCADHGYPYLYYEHPDEALAPLADLGRGSSAGGVCYLETAFPPEFRGNLFFCEWGRSIVRYERRRAGSGFGPVREIEFAAGAPNDPYGFNPTDVIVDRDGSLLISDWCDGQRPKRGRGRIYRISYGSQGGDTASARSLPIAQLDSPSYHVRVAAQQAIEEGGGDAIQAVLQALKSNTLGSRGKMHAIWILAHSGGAGRIADLFAITQSDTDSKARIQAVRAIADICDPDLAAASTPHAFDRNDIAHRLTELANIQDPAMLREIVIALGRLYWADLPSWLREHLVNPDPALAHATMQALRRTANWPVVTALLNDKANASLHNIAIAACAGRAEPVVVEALIERLRDETNPNRRQRYIDLLSRVHRKPGPWKYWDYRPAPRPPNTENWERSGAIAEALDCCLSDADAGVRAAALRSMRREQIPMRAASLSRMLETERATDRVQDILDALAKLSIAEKQEPLRNAVRNRDLAVESRAKALAMWIDCLDGSTEGELLKTGEVLEDGPVLAAVLDELAKVPQVDSGALLQRKWTSASADVRTAAVRSAVKLRLDAVKLRVADLLDDRDAPVRREAAVAAGVMGVKTAAANLLRLAREDEPLVRAASFDSLRQLIEPGAVSAAVAALELPAAELSAINYLCEFGTPLHTDALLAAASRNRSVDLLYSVSRGLMNWATGAAYDAAQRQHAAHAIAQLQGRTGALLYWRILGPIPIKEAAELREKQELSAAELSGWPLYLAGGTELRIDLQETEKPADDRVWLAVTDVVLDEPARVQFLASSSTTMHVWLGRNSVLEHQKASAYQPESDRFETELVKGGNRVFVELGATDAAVFHMRFRPHSSSAEHEKLAQYALANSGDVERGRVLFRKPEKSLCAKCHRIGDVGGNIGPDLTGVGQRFAKIHLVESILEPSRTVNPAYQTITVATTDGRIVTGVKITENDAMLTLGDEKGERHEIRIGDIDQRTAQSRSIMPDGIEKNLNEREFLDLLTYLVAERKK